MRGGHDNPPQLITNIMVYYKILLKNGNRIRVNQLDEPVYQCYVTGGGSMPKFLNGKEMEEQKGMRFPNDPVFNLRHENGTYFEDIGDMMNAYKTHGNYVEKMERVEE